MKGETTMTRLQAMNEKGYKRSARLTMRGQTDTMNYGTIGLMRRNWILKMGQTEYVETDNEYEVDIYYNFETGKYYACDAFERNIW